MAFDDGSEDSLVSRFSKKFITAEWFDKYEEAYEDRVQLYAKSPWEFMNVKRALLRKLDPQEIKDKTEKQVVREIRKGVLPEVRKFCDYTEKNPFNNLDKSKIHTFEGLEILLWWVEQCQNNIGSLSGIDTGMELVKGEPQQVNAILCRNRAGNTKRGSGSGGNTKEQDASIDQEVNWSWSWKSYLSKTN